MTIGNKVVVLDEDVEGVVVGFSEAVVRIETTDGFELTYKASELLVIQDDSALRKGVKNSEIHQVIKEKQEPAKRSFFKEKSSEKEEFVLEVDLHIEKLVRKKGGLSNFEILNIQMDTAKGQLEFAMRNRMPKMVFIHGVGEGVLRAELEFLLKKYDHIVFYEANYQKYGQGATEVYFKQNKNE